MIVKCRSRTLKDFSSVRRYIYFINEVVKDV